MKILKADKGKVYTDGSAYGKEIVMPDSADSSRWYQIDDPDPKTDVDDTL